MASPAALAVRDVERLRLTIDAAAKKHGVSPSWVGKRHGGYRYNKPKARSEAEIRWDLAEQLEAIVKRWAM